MEYVYGIFNDLLKVGLLDCKEDLYMVGIKFFLYIFKFIILFLWWLIELLGYFLDMNENFNMLVNLC